MEHLTKFNGIGPVFAKKLYDELILNGLLSNKKYTKEEIRSILLNPKIFEKLSIATQADIIHNPDEEIPREAVEILDNELHNNIKGIKFNVVGSYRRKKPICHDVDIVISKGKNATAAQIWDKIFSSFSSKQKIYFDEPYAMGEGKISTYVNIKWEGKTWIARTDVFITPPNEYIFMLLYGTGSGLFNIRMRALAKRRGYLLNQKGLFKRNGKKLTRVSIKSEKEIFEILGMQYKIPSKRNK